MVKAVVKGRVRNMVKHRHKPPSRVRYEQEHPVVSARIATDLHKQLKEYLASRKESLADFIRESLGVQKPLIDKIVREACEKGYNEATKKFKVWYYCAHCGKEITMSPNSPSHKAVIGYMKEHGWRHNNCGGKL